MSGRVLYDETTRRRAAALFEEGMGYKAVASLLGIPRETVRKWLDVYRSVGIEVLAMMGKKHTTYSFETKLAAVRAVVDAGMTRPEEMAEGVQGGGPRGAQAEAQGKAEGIRLPA